MAKEDKMTRDIKNSLRDAFGAAPKYGTGVAKLFLATGGEYFKNQMPAPVAVYETNKDILQNFWRTLRNPSDAANRYTQRITGGDTYKNASKFAKAALEDLKTGNFYDKNRSRQSFFDGFDDPLENFGGFDMTGFDSNGDWSEDNTGTDDFDAQLKIAEAQEASANERTEAVVDTIVAGSDAIIANRNAIATNELRIGMKQHTQIMGSMQNIITQQVASNKMQQESINAMLDVTREAHNQVMEKMSSIENVLTEIRDYVKPKEQQRREYKEHSVFGLNGELNLKKYAANIKKNIQNKFLFGGDLGMLTGGFSLADTIDLWMNNPWMFLSERLFPRMVPKTFKKQMERTNRNISNFMPALMTKFADRGRKFEKGESKSKLDMLLGLLGVETSSDNTIRTDRLNYLQNAKFTDKTVRAIEEVIPTLLAKIESNISGGPMMVYDYKTGKFVRAMDVIAKDSRTARDLVGPGGKPAYEIMKRAGKYNFTSDKESDDFKDYVYQFLQHVAENGTFVNPKMSESEFKKIMPEPKDSTKKQGYYKKLIAILRQMPEEDLMEMSKSMLYARSSREKSVFNLNEFNADTGRVAAWSGLLDPGLQKAIIEASKNRAELSYDDITKLSESEKNKIVKKGGATATNTLLSDILYTLRGGIVTYSYHLGFVGGKQLKDGNTPISRQTQSVLSTLEAQRADVEKKKEEERKEAERKLEEIAKKQEEVKKKLADMGRDPSEYFADDLDLEGLMAIQKAITIEEYSPDDPKKKEQEKKKEKYKNYGSVLEDAKNKLKGKLPKSTENGKFGRLREVFGMPFNIMEKGMRVADLTMMKLLYGGDIDLSKEELWKDKDGNPYLFGTLSAAVETHFSAAKEWFSENIGNPVKDYFFDKDEGLLPRMKDAVWEMFGIEEKKEAVKKKFNEMKTSAVNKLRGTYNESTGMYEGGVFSNQANALRKMKNDTKNSLVGSIAGAVSGLLYGENKEGKGVNFDYDFDENGNQIITRQYSGVIGRLRQGFDMVDNFLFGDKDNDPHNANRRHFRALKEEFGKAFPNAIVGAGAGAIASLFLPGGPLLGAIIGGGLGLVKGSEQLKTFLFGENVEEDDTYVDPFTGKVETRLGPDGKPIKKKTRKGKLISQEVYEGFKKFAPKVAVGAGVGALASIFLPGGPLIGSLIGSIGGMTAASDQLKALIFGPDSGKEEDKDKGLISKNFREKAGNWLKANLPATMAGALAGGAAWHMISQVGLIPGLSILPGGPILGFIGASVGLANADKINKFFFGEEVDGEETEEVTDPKTGKKKTVTKKTKKREGGVFNKVFDSVKEKAITPLAKGFNTIGQKISGWFQDAVVEPFKRALDPMKASIAKAGEGIRDSMMNIGKSITEAIFGKEGEEGSLREQFKSTIKKKFLDPLKKVSDTIFGFIGKLIGGIISAPFKALEFIFNGTIGGKSPAERREEKRNARWDKRREAVNRRMNSRMAGLKGMFARIMGGIKDDFTMFSPEEYDEYLRTGRIPDRMPEDFKARHDPNYVPGSGMPAFGTGGKAGSNQNGLGLPPHITAAMQQGGVNGPMNGQQKQGFFARVRAGIKNAFTVMSPEEYEYLQKYGYRPDAAQLQLYMTNRRNAINARGTWSTGPVAGATGGIPGAAGGIAGGVGGAAGGTIAGAAALQSANGLGPTSPGLTMLDYQNEVGPRATLAGYAKWYNAKKRELENKKNNASGHNKAVDKNDNQTDDLNAKDKDKDPEAKNAEANQESVRRRFRRRKTDNDYLSEIAKFTKKINSKLSDNINGVGWNIAYITTLLKKQFGELSPEELPEEMEGSRKVKKRKTLLGKVVGGVKDFFVDKVGGAGKKVKGFFGIIVDMIMRPFEFVGKAIKGVGKGLAAAGKAAVDLAFKFTDVLGTAVKETAKTLGVALRETIKVVGKTLQGVVGIVAEAGRGIAAALSEAVVAVSSLVRGAFEIAADIIPDVVHAAWTGVKGLGKAAFKGVRAVGRGIGRGIKAGIGFIGSKISGRGKKGGSKTKTKNIRHFMDGGRIDTIGGIEEPVQIMAGSSLEPRPIPIVDVFHGKSLGKNHSAVPVYIMGFDRWARCPGKGAPKGLPFDPNTNANDPNNAGNAIGGNALGSGPSALPTGGVSSRQKLNKYINAYRKANARTEDAQDPTTVYDSLILNASSPEEIQAIKDVQQLNGDAMGSRLRGKVLNDEEKENSGFWKMLLGLLGGGGIAGILASILGFVGIGGLIGNGIHQDDPAKVVRGVEAIKNIALRKLGMGGLRGASVKTGEGLVKAGGLSIKEISQRLANPATAYKEAELMAEASYKTAGKKASDRVMRAAVGRKSLARLGEFTQAFKYGVEEGLDKSNKGLTKMFTEDMIQAGSSGFRSKIGGALGRAQGNLRGLGAKAIDRVFGSFEKASVIKKFAGKLKIDTALRKLRDFLKGPVLEKAVKEGGKSVGEKAAKQLAVFASGPFFAITTIGFAIADFVTGWNNARKYFSVFGDDVTKGMKFTAAIVNTLEGLIGLIPGIGIPLSIALAFFTDKIVQLVYNAVASDDAKQELEKKQKDLQAQTDAYNQANNTDLTTDEYADQYNSDGTENTGGFWKKAKNFFKNLGFGGNKTSSGSSSRKNSSAYNMRYDASGNLVGKGRGLTNNDPNWEKGWGAGARITPMNQHSAMFNRGNRLMADAGCGPTAGAMVASAYGVKLNPEQISRDSFASGMRAKDGGMNPQYFSQMAGKYGSGFGMAQGPVDGARISSNLAAGRPVVMMGKGGPYGPTTHYMVAEGLSGRGGVRMIDPNSGSRKTVSGKNLLRNSTASIYSWGRGNGIVTPTGIGFDQSKDKTIKNDMTVSAIEEGVDVSANSAASKLYGAGRVISEWGRGILDVAKAGASTITGGNSKVKDAITSIMNEYNNWNRSWGGSWGARRTDTNPARYHAGIDLSLKNGRAGSPMKSFTNGVVELVKYGKGRGYYVVIKDEFGFYHIYQHMNAASPLSVGQSVGIGTIVGGYGGSGGNFALHLHYEIRRPDAKNTPGGLMGTASSDGYIHSTSELNLKTADPYSYLQQYMSGNIDASKINMSGGSSEPQINIVQQTSYNLITKNGRSGVKYIVMHYTTSVSSAKGQARATCSIWANGKTKGSADYVVDDAEIVQYNPDPSKHSTWHCGDSPSRNFVGKPSTSVGATYQGKCKNSNSIGVEMCSYNTTGKYEDDVSPNAHWGITPATQANAARLVKYLMNKYNIPIENVIMHHHVSGKVCPQPWCHSEPALANYEAFKKQVMSTNLGGTTTDASGTSGTQGQINAPPGIKALNAINEMFEKYASPFDKTINAILNQNDTSSEETTEDTGTTTSTGVPNVNDQTGDMYSNAKYIYKWLKQIGTPNDHIAAVLSNWNAESQIDPTVVETINSGAYQMTDAKIKAMENPNDFFWNKLVPAYQRSGISINKPQYKGEDGIYYPGVGLGGFTGSGVSWLMAKAKEIGKPWYDIDTQLRLTTDTEGTMYKGGRVGNKGSGIWFRETFSPKSFSSPTEAAAWFEKHWEGTTFRQAEHTKNANKWLGEINKWEQEPTTTTTGSTGSSSGILSNISNAVTNAVAGLPAAGGSGFGLTDWGAGPGLDTSYNISSMNDKLSGFNKSISKIVGSGGVNSSFKDTYQQIKNRADSSDDTTAKILAFLTENIGTLIQYVSNIADKMPERREVSDVKKNMAGYRSRNRDLPGTFADNTYSSTPTAGNPEDVGMKIMNSLTSK